MEKTRVADEVQGLSTDTLDRPADEDVYDRHSPAKKAMFVTILALCGVPAPMSSTGSLIAADRIAESFSTTASIVNISNGVYIAMMGISAIFWGPLSTLVGRRPVVYTGSLLFFICSIGTALAPNLAVFFFTRLLSGAGGTAVLIAGSGCIGDLYKPVSAFRSLITSRVLLNQAFTDSPLAPDGACDGFGMVRHWDDTWTSNR